MKKLTLLFVIGLSILFFAACGSGENDKLTSETSSLQIQDSSATDEQQRLLTVFTQSDCSDRGYELTYEGFDTWDIARQDVDGVSQWIVTTKDKEHGRVKAIYEWDGDDDSGATLVYLLVSGDELVNDLK